MAERPKVEVTVLTVLTYVPLPLHFDQVAWLKSHSNLYLRWGGTSSSTTTTSSTNATHADRYDTFMNFEKHVKLYRIPDSCKLKTPNPIYIYISIRFYLLRHQSQARLSRRKSKAQTWRQKMKLENLRRDVKTVQSMPPESKRNDPNVKHHHT